MRTGWGSSLGLSLLGVVACASAREVGLAQLIEQGRSNELGAIAEYRGERLRSAGVVTRTGMKRVGHFVGEASPGLLGPTVEVTEVKTGYPYLYAGAPGGAGQLLCFFEPNELERVAQLRAGDQVVLDGDFQEYADGGATVVLNTCELR